MIPIGKNIKNLRLEREMTQERVAEAFGVTFQTISKWEREESYPDITLLPSIASYFGVSCDELLGVDKEEKEEKIQQYIKLYDELRLKDSPYVFEQMSQAIKEFPGEFRLLARYLDMLIFIKSAKDCDSEDILDEVEKLYNRLLNGCTDDKIRIWIKRRICMYYNTLSHKTGKDKYSEKMLEIAKEMPCMIDCREYLETVINLPDDDHYSACKVALDNEMLLFMSTISNMLFYKKHFPVEYQIAAMEKCLDVLNVVYDDGNYGSCYRSVIFLLGDLGRMYCENGDTNKGLEHLRKCAEHAKKHDELPEETTHNSMLLNGAIYKKTKFGKTMCERMKDNFLNKYNLSEDIKNAEEFKAVISILE